MKKVIKTYKNRKKINTLTFIFLNNFTYNINTNKNTLKIKNTKKIES